jgi:ubiquinone/menaquinone biosynthesis C-methylase UbiE
MTMLPRVLEPEVMDSAAEASDYDAMDHASVNRVFVADFLASWKPHGRVLDVGTGTAQIPMEFCKQSPAGKIIAIDLAAHMVELARRNVAKAGLSERIDVQLADAKGLPFPDSHFDAVMSNSIVHHIPEPLAVLADMVRTTAPGGTIFVRDLMRPRDDGTVAYLVDNYAADANAHQRKMFDDSLRAALTIEEMRDRVAKLGFARESVQPTSDRHWTWCAAVAATASPR